MFSIKKIIVWVMVLVPILFSGSEALSAAFDSKKTIVVDGLLYRVDAKGQKKQFEGAEVVEEKIDSGKIYWLAADPKADGQNKGLYKGWKSGIYFFGKDGKFISCLERKAAQLSYVHFSPNGKQFILASGTYVDLEYKLYTFGTLELKKTFYGMSQLVWLDSRRFVFSAIDTARGPRHKNADIAGWRSVVLYDTASGTLKTLINATKVADFDLQSIDTGKGKLSITKYSVKSENDWANEKKVSSEEIFFPIPTSD